MTPDALWKRDAAICCDPNGLVQGRLVLSDCMGDFQRGAA
jgi:hypothetical protein